MNIKLLGLLTLLSSYAQAQQLLVTNRTDYQLNIYLSSWIKPDPKHDATVHTKKIKLFAGKTVELGDTKATMINEIRVGAAKHLLSMRPTVDMASLNKALKRARKYRNGAITLIFNKEPKGKKIYVTAVSEKEQRDLPVELGPSLK